MDQAQQIAFLRKIAFFHDFDDNELKQFLTVSKWLKVSENKLVIRQDTIDRAFYILVKGQVGVFKVGEAAEQEVPLTTLSNGDCFGEMALVGDVRRTASVKSLQECYILRVEPDIISTSNVFLQLKFYKRFCEIMVSRLDYANRRLALRPEMPVGDLAGEKRSAPVGAVEVGAGRSGRGDEAGGAEEPLPPMPDPEKRVAPARLRRNIAFEDILVVNPAVSERLQTVLAGPDSDESTRRLAELIALDPVLTCRVLQIANSPFYRRAISVTTVAHALIIAGAASVRKVIGETLEQAGDAPFAQSAFLAPAFWRHGVVVGRIAEMLAEMIGINLPADIYLAGLLHDLGILILERQVPDFYPQLQRPDCPFHADLTGAEREYIGVDHGQAGAWLAESLGLPSLYVDAMRFHHLPEKAVANRLPVALVSLANAFAVRRSVSLRGRAGAGLIDPAKSYAWVMIQSEHRPFIDVHLPDFIALVDKELDKAWPALNSDIPL